MWEKNYSSYKNSQFVTFFQTHEKGCKKNTRQQSCLTVNIKHTFLCYTLVGPILFCYIFLGHETLYHVEDNLYGNIIKCCISFYRNKILRISKNAKEISFLIFISTYCPILIAWDSMEFYKILEFSGQKTDILKMMTQYIHDTNHMLNERTRMFIK